MWFGLQEFKGHINAVVVNRRMAAARSSLLAAACRNSKLFRATIEGETVRWCVYRGSRLFSMGGIKTRLDLSASVFRPFFMSGMSLTHSVHVSL